jgi:hypothetical protein
MLSGNSAILGAAPIATGGEAVAAQVAAAAAKAALPTVSIVATDPTATETLSGQTSDKGLLTVSRTGSTTKALTVKYTISGSASNGTDYTRIGTSVVIAAGRSSATVSIAPVNDALVEGNETVKPTLSGSTAYTVNSAKSAATVTIVDNDAPDPKVAAIAREVQRTNSTPAVDSYEEFFSLLPVNQGVQRGYSQKTPQRDLVAARSTIFAELSRALSPAGGSVSYQDFTAGGYAGRNIVGVLPGQGPHKNQQYVIGAHYDSEQNPGADDDGSGVAGLLEAANVLAKHKFDATVILVAYDQEEERSNGWGQGSQFFATRAKASAADIRGAVVLDMIAYNGGGNIAVVGQSDSSSTSPSAALAGKIAEAFGTYTTLTSQRMTGFDDTDGYRLYQAGFPSATVIEQLDANGDLLNPYYHEASDYYRSASGQTQKYNGREYLDFVYATEMTRGTIAWAAGGAVVLDGSPAAAEAAMAATLQQAGTLQGAWFADLPSISGTSRVRNEDSQTQRAAAILVGQSSLAGQAISDRETARPAPRTLQSDATPGTGLTQDSDEDATAADLALGQLPWATRKAASIRPILAKWST